MSDLHIILSEFLENSRINFKEEILKNLRITLYKTKGYKIRMYSYDNLTGEFLGKDTIDFSTTI
jgi:hypothetical protein